MIKLSLAEKPTELTKALEAQLVNEYKSDKSKEVWRRPYIEKALLEMTHNKCAYSEQKLNQESAYMEIDHFRCKEKYVNEVVSWGNLLPSCKKCNTSKGDHDVVAEPIVNPLVDEPKDFMFVKAFRYYKRDEKGQTTIDVLSINDRTHFVSPSANIGFAIADKIETLFEKLKVDNTERKRRSTLSKLKSALEECGPENEYSAVISTFILYECETYNDLECYLVANHLWDAEFEAIKKQLSAIAMPK
jgi:uncharacterized protein (TIGR02646 family)